MNRAHWDSTPDLFADDSEHAPAKTDNSPAAIAQRGRLLEALSLGAVTTPYARKELGIMMPSARISELRSEGRNIITEKISIEDERGCLHRGVARYVLIQSVIENKIQARG